VITTDHAVAEFVSKALGFGLCPPYTQLGIVQDRKVIGGVVFNMFEGSDLHFTAAGRGWSPAFMRAVGQYVYSQLGCERMTCITEQPSVARLAIRLGGKVEGTLRNHFGPNRDGTLIGILRNEWKYRTIPANLGTVEPLHVLPDIRKRSSGLNT